jgi:hypothetical protein
MRFDCWCVSLCQLERKARDDLLAKERQIGQLLAVVQRQRRWSANAATPNGALASPSVVARSSIEQPIVELLHHPELLRTLNQEPAVAGLESKRHDGHAAPLVKREPNGKAVS